MGADSFNPGPVSADPPPPGANERAAPRSDEQHNGSRGRYRPLPTGVHGLAPADVERDQRERLTLAMIELTAERGYEAVRILDLTRLARVSRPTFYELYTDKEALLLGTYDGIAERIAQAVIEAVRQRGAVADSPAAGDPRIRRTRRGRAGNDGPVPVRRARRWTEGAAGAQSGP